MLGEGCEGANSGLIRITLLQGSLTNIPEYTSSRNDVSRSRSGSGAIKRYGSLRQNHPLGESQVSIIMY